MTVAEKAARALFEDVERGCLTRGQVWFVQAIGTAAILLLAAWVLLPVLRRVLL